MPELSSQISSAATKLKAGKIVAFPTETVYGLGADISIPSAVNRIFEIKERPELEAKDFTSNRHRRND